MALFQLAINIGVKDGASGPIKKVGGSVNNLGRDFRALGKNTMAVGGHLTRLLAPLGAITSVVSVAGIGRLIKSTAELGDKIGNLARQTGVSATFLQEYGFAVESCDMESQDFYNSIEKMNSNMGKLRQGTGPLVTDLNKISPALAKQIKAAESNEEAFNLMLESLRKIPDAERRARLASIYFGEANVKMANLANLSAAELDGLKAKANELGFVFDTESSEAFNASLTNLSRASRGLKITIGTQLLPIVTPLVDKLAGWIAANREIISIKVGKYVEQLATALDRVDIDKVFKGVGHLIGGIGKLIDFVGGAKNALILLFVFMNGGLISSTIKLAGSILSLGLNAGGAAVGLGCLKFGLLALASPLGIVALAAGAAIGILMLLGKQAENTGRTLMGIDAEGNQITADPDDLGPFGYMAAGTGRFIAGTGGLGKPGTKLYDDTQYYAAKRQGFGNLGLAAGLGAGGNLNTSPAARAETARQNAQNQGLNIIMAALANIKGQSNKTDIVMDFKNVPKGADVSYTISGAAASIDLNVEYVPAPQI